MDILSTEELTSQQVDALMALALFAGTLYCFLGYRTLKFIIGLTGFLMAGAMAGVLAGWASEGHALSMGIAALIGGICGAMALFFLYRTGIFFLGLLGAVAIAHHVLMGRPESWVPLAILGAGAVGGLIALVVERPIVTAATAAIGAWLMIRSSYHFIEESGLAADWSARLEGLNPDWVVIGSWGALFILGALTQHATRKRSAPKPNPA